MCEHLAIGDEEKLARHIKAPLMLTDDQEELTWQNVFEFPGGAPESLFWLKHIAMAEVHSKGCDWQREARRTRPKASYRGTVVANSGVIRGFRSARGHGFTIEHHPQEGIFHIHMFYATQPGPDFNKQDKIEMRYALSKIFSLREQHVCTS